MRTRQARWKARGRSCRRREGTSAPHRAPLCFPARSTCPRREARSPRSRGRSRGREDARRRRRISPRTRRARRARGPDTGIAIPWGARACFRRGERRARRVPLFCRIFRSAGAAASKRKNRSRYVNKSTEPVLSTSSLRPRPTCGGLRSHRLSAAHANVTNRERRRTRKPHSTLARTLGVSSSSSLTSSRWRRSPPPRPSPSSCRPSCPPSWRWRSGS